MSGAAPIPAPTPARPLQYLAFDFGTKRIGVASGNSVLGQAQALTTVKAEGATARFERIGALISEWQPDALVVGVPRHPDGAAHDNTRLAQRFARQLQGRFGLPVHEVDERYTTVAVLADSTHQGTGRSTDVDAASAALILDQYLRNT